MSVSAHKNIQNTFKIYDSYDMSAWKNSTDHDKNSGKGILMLFLGVKR